MVYSSSVDTVERGFRQSLNGVLLSGWVYPHMGTQPMVETYEPVLVLQPVEDTDRETYDAVDRLAKVLEGSDVPYRGMSQEAQPEAPPYEVGDRFDDIGKSDAEAWEVVDIQWEQRWNQGDGAWAYHMEQVDGDRSLHMLLSGLKWDISKGRLALDQSTRRSDGGGYDTFPDVTMAERARYTSAFTRSSGGVTPVRTR